MHGHLVLSIICVCVPPLGQAEEIISVLKCTMYLLKTVVA